MKSAFEEYSSNQNIWKTYGNKPLSERERLLIDEYIVKEFHKNGHLNILDAGTGSGRISFRIKENADVDIDAFDFIPSFIEQAEITKRQKGAKINFFVRNAVDLSGLTDNGYDVLVYFQQLLSFIPREQLCNALSECTRLCKPGGLFLLSYANYDNRRIDLPLSFLLTIVRFFRKDALSKQELPYLHTNNKKGKRIINLSYFGCNQGLIYWFRNGELEDAIEAVGFEVIRSLDENKRIVFLVCKKRLK